MMTKHMEVKLKLSILREITELKLELSCEMVKKREMTMLVRLSGGTAASRYIHVGIRSFGYTVHVLLPKFGCQMMPDPILLKKRCVP